MSAKEYEVQTFSQVTKECHPAVPYVLAFLEAQVDKDYEAFAACFGEESDFPVFYNLPGGLIMRNPKQLLERHREFYKSPDFQVQYDALQDGMGNKDFFVCSTRLFVRLPEGKSRTNYVDMLFLRQQDNEPTWVPVRLINTVEDL